MISTSTRLPQVMKPQRSISVPVAIALSTIIIVLVTLGKPFVDIPGVVDGSAHAIRSIDTQLFDSFDRPNYWYAPWTNSLEIGRASCREGRKGRMAAEAGR